MTAAEKATAIKNGRKVTPKPFTPEEQGFVDLENLPDKGVPTERVVVEYPGKGLYVSKYPRSWRCPYAAVRAGRILCRTFLYFGEQKRLRRTSTRASSKSGKRSKTKSRHTVKRDG
jgi:hypothetical protein